MSLGVACAVVRHRIDALTRPQQRSPAIIARFYSAFTKLDLKPHEIADFDTSAIKHDIRLRRVGMRG
jgi:hypothetical protein